jgi:hypothetical protein
VSSKKLERTTDAGVERRSAGGVVWRREADPGAATPPRYGNRRTAVDRENDSGPAVYSTSPKRAVMYPRRLGRRWT